MGGTGSGGYAHHGLVEQAFRLDVPPLVKAAQGRGGRALLIVERPGGRLCDAVERIEVAVRLGPAGGTLVLRYVAVGRDDAIVPVREVVGLEARPQFFGGVSWYARCPRTGDLVKVLRMPYGWTRFASRQAAGLVYISTRDASRDRHLLRAQRIRRKLGGPEFWSLGTPFPPRPRYMRKARYAALRAKARDALACDDAARMPALQRWVEAVGKRGQRSV